jgi:arginine transport system permease protein
MLGYIQTLLPSLKVSLLLTFIALTVAFFLALGCTILLSQANKFIKLLVGLYLTIFTGTPLLVQFFLIYYGPGQFQVLKQCPWLWSLLSSPLFCAATALALNSAAYTTQLFNGALQGIAKGQWQACLSLGMNKRQSLAVLIPYAIKRALSSYSNEVILVFKSTSLAFTITLLDVMGMTQQLYGSTYDVKVFVAAGIIYLVVNSVLTLLLRLLERRALSFELPN